MVKSPDEIERIRRSVETNSRAFEQAVARVKPGMKESDLAAELEYRMRRLGAEKPSFETIVAGGARSAWPHAQPTASHAQARRFDDRRYGSDAGWLRERHDAHAVSGRARTRR